MAIKGILGEALRQWWFEDDIFQLGAALSYYAVFAISPLVVIAVAAAGLVYGEEAARGELVQQIEQATGPTIAEAIQDLVKHAHVSGAGKLATFISMALLTLGATGFFAQLQHSLNHIWGVRARGGRGLWGVAKDRLWSFLMILCLALLLLVALLLNSSLGLVQQHVPVLGSRIVHWLVSMGLLTLLFSIMYKVLPDVLISWRVVWLGAVVTALLFNLGNYLIGLYLAQTSTASAYGAAGSLVVVLAWVYYSSIVVLFGAEVTEACAKRFGHSVVPTAIAEADPHSAKGLPGTEDSVAL